MPLYFIIEAIYLSILLLICFLSGCLLVRKGWPLEYKLLVVLCSLTFFVEESALFLFFRWIPHDWIYNLFTPLECGFILYIFYRGSTNPSVKRVNAILLACLPPGIAAFFFLHPVFFIFNESALLFYLFSELIGACAVLIGILLNQSDTSLGHQPLFWMACGILFYSCIFTVLHAYLNAMPKNVIPKNSFLYYTIYSFIANNFMYIGFIACFFSMRRLSRTIQPAPVFLTED